MKIGYARVSTLNQKLDLQLNALISAGCEVIYSEKLGATKLRPEFNKCMKSLNKSDTLICYKLDRLGRSLRDVINVIYELNSKGVELISLSDKMDTTTSQGRLMLNILLSFAQFEREIIIDRTKAGLQAARERGVKLGRPLDPKVRENRRKARKMRKQNYKISYICKTLNISRSTCYEYIS